jgi:hypothetical protein
MTEDQSVIFVCFSIRGSERVATQTGAKLDTIKRPEKAFVQLQTRLFDTPQCQEQSRSIGNFLLKHRSTAIFENQFKRLFSGARYCVPEATPLVNIHIDKTTGTYQALTSVFLLSTSTCLDSVEGDDFVAVLALRKTNGVGSIQLERPSKPGDVVLLLKALKLWPDVGELSFSDNFRAGFYIVPADSSSATAGTLTQSALDDESYMVAMCSGTAYFYYCWLVCQRGERNLLAVSANGDWDDEFRKLLLVKKQVIAARKTALLKNRAFPESHLLPHFKSCIDVFRLESQLAYLTEQTDETANALDMQNSYVTSSRIRSIEWIIFLSTILGLAVAVNALQMAPFYDSTTANALERPIFWYVFMVVAAGGLLLWGVLSNWKQARKKLQSLGSKINGEWFK